MFFHSHLMSELAETRAAEHHDTARQAREAAHAQQEPPSIASSPLHAYPRLCGLPVTIERVAVNGAAADRRVTRLRFRPMPRRWLRASDE